MTFRYFSKSLDQTTGVVRLENPERRAFPEWKPKSLPLSQTDSNLTLTLAQCKLSTTTLLFRSTYLPSRSMADTENAGSKESIPCLSTQFHATEAGRNTDKETQLLSATISDATGNSYEKYFKSFWVKPGRYDAPKYDVAATNGSEGLKSDFEYGFCIGEKAVRLEVQAIRSPNASPSLANQKRIADMTPPVANGAVSFQKIYMNGLPVKIALCGPANRLILDQYNKIETNLACAILKVPPMSFDLLTVLLRVADSSGNSLSDGFVLKDMKFNDRRCNDYSLMFERSSTGTNWALSAFSKQAYNPNMGHKGDRTFDAYLIFPFTNPPGNKKLAVSIVPNPPMRFDFTAPVANH